MCAEHPTLDRTLLYVKQQPTLFKIDLKKSDFIRYKGSLAEKIRKFKIEIDSMFVSKTPFKEDYVDDGFVDSWAIVWDISYEIENILGIDTDVFWGTNPVKYVELEQLCVIETQGIEDFIEQKILKLNTRLKSFYEKKKIDSEELEDDETIEIILTKLN